MQIRLTEAEHAALKRAAASEFLAPSAWARQQLMRSLVLWQAGEAFKEMEALAQREREQEDSDRR